MFDQREWREIAVSLTRLPVSREGIGPANCLGGILVNANPFPATDTGLGGWLSKGGGNQGTTNFTPYLTLTLRRLGGATGPPVLLPLAAPTKVVTLSAGSEKLKESPSTATAGCVARLRVLDVTQGVIEVVLGNPLKVNVCEVALWFVLIATTA